MQVISDGTFAQVGRQLAVQTSRHRRWPPPGGRAAARPAVHRNGAVAMAAPAAAADCRPCCVGAELWRPEGRPRLLPTQPQLPECFCRQGFPALLPGASFCAQPDTASGGGVGAKRLAHLRQCEGLRAGLPSRCACTAALPLACRQRCLAFSPASLPPTNDAPAAAGRRSPPI